MDLYPAGGAGDVLPVVLRAPALDEAHADGAHLGQVVDGLKAVVDGLAEEGGELLVVEDLEGAPRGDLAHGRGVEAVMVVAVAALNKDAAVAQAFRKNLSTNVVQMDTCKETHTRIINKTFG